MEDAVFIIPCQHGGCKNCFNDRLTFCPICREDIGGQNRSKILNDRRTREIINNLIFKCLNNGCEKTYRLIDENQE